jgi:hypothetical protein
MTLTEFTPLAALAGSALVGLSSVMLIGMVSVRRLANRRVPARGITSHGR